MKTIKPSPKVLIFWRWLITIISIIPVFFAAFFLNGNIQKISLAIWALLYLFWFVFYLPFFYNSTVCTLTKDYISIKKGVFVTRIYNIPYDKIFFLTVYRYPSSGLFGIFNLNVSTAGFFVSMPGLTQDKLEEITSMIPTTGPSTDLGGRAWNKELNKELDKKSNKK